MHQALGELLVGTRMTCAAGLGKVRFADARGGIGGRFDVVHAMAAGTVRNLHAARAADIVFARSHLLEFLSRSKRPFFRFDDFFEINDKLNDLMRVGLFTQSERINFLRFLDGNRRNIRALWENGEVMRSVGYPHGLGWSQAQFDSIWPQLRDDPNALHLVLEDSSGRFLGEAFEAAHHVVDVAIEEAIGGLQFGGPGEDRGHRPLGAPGAGGADLNQAPGPGGVLQLGPPK